MGTFSITRHKGGVVFANGNRIIGSIGKAAISSFPRPSAGDDSIWTGSPTWGPGVHERLDTPHDQLAFYTSWNYICVRYNSTQVSRQRLRLYKRKRKGQISAKLLFAKTKALAREQKQYLYSRKGLDPWLSQADDVEEITQHPFLDLMKRPNPFLSGADLWSLAETFMGLTGDAFFYKRPATEGAMPSQLWVMETQNVRIIPGKSMDEYLLGYLYQTGTKQVPFAPEEVVHFKYPNPFNQLKGYSPLQGIAAAVLTNDYMARYDTATFKNMARPDGVLETEESLGDNEYRRLKREWNSTFGGVNAVGKVLILEGKARYKQVTMSPKDLNHQVGRKLTREEIADGHGVPMPLLSPDSSNLAVAQVAYSQYMRDTIDPKLRLYEDGLNTFVIPDYVGGEDLFCAFDDCVPADREMQLKERAQNLSTFYSTVNQERAKDGEEPQEEYGDLPLVGSGIKELGEEPKPQFGFTVGPNGEPIMPKPEPEEEEEKEKEKPKEKPTKKIAEEEESIRELVKGIVDNLFERLRTK